MSVDFKFQALIPDPSFPGSNDLRMALLCRAQLNVAYIQTANSQASSRSSLNPFGC